MTVDANKVSALQATLDEIVSTNIGDNHHNVVVAFAATTGKILAALTPLERVAMLIAILRCSQEGETFLHAKDVIKKAAA